MELKEAGEQLGWGVPDYMKREPIRADKEFTPKALLLIVAALAVVFIAGLVLGHVGVCVGDLCGITN